MTDEPMELCLQLMMADDSVEVVEILNRMGYWQDRSAWRHLGDTQNNWSTIGAQQSDPVAALAEKLVNSIDACLLGECQKREIDPRDPHLAPASPEEAIRTFFPGSDGITGKRGQIFVTVTKGDGRSSISVVDLGEGQKPCMFSETFMSLATGNKQSIPFVQGKFNMGGTGALRFCEGPHHLQLLVSRRNQQIVDSSACECGGSWGFTIVRRVDPSVGRKSTEFEYLAPLDGQQVLCFSADEMPLIPNPQARNSQEERAYGRAAGHGTLVKLYGYDVPGIRSSVTGDTGLMKRMNTMIPRALMPIRFFDARGKRKWQTASGIQNDIEGRDGTDLAIEPHIVDSLPFVGNSLPLEIYAFERGAGAKYRVGTGQTILFTVNGQVHASRGSDFLKASRVNRSDVADDILIVVDCTALPERLKEDLFMNSRDRMQSGPLREQMETELASALHDNEPLSELNQRRRLQRVSDSKAAEEEISEVLESILRSEPRLLNALASGGKSGRFRNPAEHDSEFIGSMYPSYFRSVRPKAVDGEVNREVAVGSRLVLNFETDASDGYFGSGRGRVRVVDIESGEDVSGLFRRSGPNSGKCTISSADIIAGHQAGDLLGLEIIVEDDNPIPLSPFVCAVYVAIVDRSSESETSPSPRDPFTGKKLPHIEFVPRERWAELNGMHGFDFGPTTVIQARPTGTEGAVGSYDLYINVDNGHLEVQRRAKPSSADGRTFLWKRTTSLIGLALASYLVDNELPGEEVELVEERITEITSGLAPVLASLPEILAAGAVKDADSREPVQG